MTPVSVKLDKVETVVNYLRKNKKQSTYFRSFIQKQSVSLKKLKP